MSKKIYGLVLLCFSFFLTGIIIFADYLFLIDERIFYCILSLRSVFATEIFLFFTYLGDWQILLFLTICAFFLLLYFKKIEAIYILIFSLFLAWTAQFILKIVIKRPRPDIEWAIVNTNSFSFPSGHAIMSFVFFAFCGYILYKNFKANWQRNLASIFFPTIIFLIGFSRVYLGAHWPSDVVASWLLGAIISILFISDYRKRFKARRE